MDNIKDNYKAAANAAEAAAADKGLLKPPGYKPILYQPANKIESEDLIDKVTQDKLQCSFTLWVMHREQNMF